MYDTNYNYFTMYKVAIGLCDTNQKHLTLNFIQFHQDKCYNERNIKLFQMLISQKHFEISHNFKLKFLRNEANNKNGIWGNFDTLMWDVYGNKEHDNEWFKLFYVAFNTYQIEKAEIGDFIAGEMYEFISAFKTYNKTELIPHFVGLYSSVLLNVNDITSLCLAQKYLIAGMLIQNITLQQDVEEYFPMITNLTNYIAKNSVTNRSALGMQATLEIMWLIAQKEIYNSSKHICTFYPTAYIIFNNDAARKSCAAFDLSRLEATDRLYIVWFIFKMCRSRKHYSLFLCKLRIAEIIRVDIQRIFQITSLSLLPYGNVYGLLYDNRNFSWIKRKIIKQKAMHEWTLSTFAYLIDFMLT
eukprot:524611_1